MTRIKVLAGMIALALTGKALALSYSVDLNEVYSGTAPASQSSPWLRATFEDIAGGKVRLTMEALNLSASEFVGSWNFNLNPAVSSESLSFNLDPSDPGLAEPDAIRHNATGQNYKAGPEKYFDIQFANETANKPDRFAAGETLIYDVGLVCGELRAADFLFVNQRKDGQALVADDWYSAAHIQAIGSGGKSGWIGAKVYYANGPLPPPESVPDAGRTLILLGVASFGLIAFSRYRIRETRTGLSQDCHKSSR